MLPQQEQKWQDRPVTYGGLARIFLFGIALTLIIVATVIWVFHIGGESWSTSSGGILAGLGVLFGLLQFFRPLWNGKDTHAERSPIEQLSSSPDKQAYRMLRKQEEEHLSSTTGTLIVLATEKHRGKMVYLLSRSLWYAPSANAHSRDKSGEKRRTSVTRLSFNDHAIYVAVFQKLKPDDYIVWTAYEEENPKKGTVTISAHRISEFELDW